jgi:hypothetical protein
MVFSIAWLNGFGTSGMTNTFLPRAFDASTAGPGAVKLGTLVEAATWEAA